MNRTAIVPDTGEFEAIPSHNAWKDDHSLRWWVNHILASLGVDASEYEQWFDEVGKQSGSLRLRNAADQANVNDPQFIAGTDSQGNDDKLIFDASWYECTNAIVSSGVCAKGVTDNKAGWVARAVAMEMWARLDLGIMCPITMTSAALPLLVNLTKNESDSCGILAKSVIEAAHRDDLSEYPLVGMSMTEPQGGSDLSCTSTQAKLVSDNSWEISGHKWFVSHPVSDAFLLLARDPEVSDFSGTRGLSCFLVPGWRSDGTRNGVVIQKLKNKLGTKSLASAEVVFDHSEAVRIGEPGRGVATIMQMVVATRMDCAIGSAGVLARAVGEVVNILQQREAFGAKLIDKPLMRRVVADLIIEREASLALSLEIARSVQCDEQISRVITAIGKYWVTRRVAYACLECVEAAGGNGYTEDYVLARLYRDAQVNSTWEGAGNVMALDVLRSLKKHPDTHDALVRHVDKLIGGSLDDEAIQLKEFVQSIKLPDNEADARSYAGKWALALEASLLIHRFMHSNEPSDEIIAKAFVSTRIQGYSERVFGDGSSILDEAADILISRVSLYASV